MTPRARSSSAPWLLESQGSFEEAVMTRGAGMRGLQMYASRDPQAHPAARAASVRCGSCERVAQCLAYVDAVGTALTRIFDGGVGLGVVEVGEALEGDAELRSRAFSPYEAA